MVIQVVTRRSSKKTRGKPSQARKVERVSAGRTIELDSTLLMASWKPAEYDLCKAVEEWGYTFPIEGLEVPELGPALLRHVGEVTIEGIKSAFFAVESVIIQTLKTQGEKITPEVLRALCPQFFDNLVKGYKKESRQIFQNSYSYSKKTLPEILSRQTSLDPDQVKEESLRLVHIAFPDLDSDIAKQDIETATKEFTEELQEFYDAFRSEIESEAIRLEYEVREEAPAAHPVATSQKKQKRGKKRDDMITGRNKEITTLLAAGKTHCEIAKHLDLRRYKVPERWVVVEDYGNQYPVGNFGRAYNIPHLRKKLKGLIYDAKRSCARVVGQLG